MHLKGVAYRIKHRFPRTYRLAQRVTYRLGHRVVRSAGEVWLRLRPPDRRSYWEQRQHMNYYREVIRLAHAYVPTGGRVIDIGAGETDIVSALPWFQRRAVLDLHPITARAGVETIQVDFLDYQPDTRFDLVLCLQVLEHLASPEAFTRKLFELGRTVIISVPYRWPEGACMWHVQDPVDEAKLERWTGRQPTEFRIVADKQERLVAVYSNGEAEARYHCVQNDEMISHPEVSAVGGPLPPLHVNTHAAPPPCPP